MSAVLPKNRPYSAEKLLGLRVVDPVRLSRQIESGLTFETFEKLSRSTGLSIDKLRPALRITPRTMSRRRIEKRLSPQESDRLLSISRLLALAFELFEGNESLAISWFTSSKRLFGGLSPLEMSTTEVGSREVEDLIGRLEHGVFS
ncbi:MAG: antitoxin Xre/MbcA/ParS toxin-binding domain-containing protein [Pyrinomonadaceae bacterium]